MANIPFGFAPQTAAPAAAPAAAPVSPEVANIMSINPSLTQDQAQALWEAMSGTMNNVRAAQGNTQGMIAGFYNTPYYSRDSNQGAVGSRGVTVYPGQRPNSPGKANYGGNGGGGGGNGNGNGGGNGSGSPVIPMPPGASGGTLPGINGNIAWTAPTLMEPPPIGTGQQWRNTMKYGS